MPKIALVRYREDNDSEKYHFSLMPASTEIEKETQEKLEDAGCKIVEISSDIRDTLYAQWNEASKMEKTIAKLWYQDEVAMNDQEIESLVDDKNLEDFV